MLAIDPARRESRRIYSSAPEQYPCQGTKPLRTDSDFYRTVFVTGEPRICRDKGECRAAFPDHALIESLGCESAINVPVRWNGVTLGSLNLLHQAAWYDASCLPILAVYAALAVPILLPASTRAGLPLEHHDHQPT
ncbi:MAG TPA: GAF domain-containing protein [Ramlibacter sp.]|nr:GAF domain-containing protein [Ramlibacter sp.]